ncbi:MFS transporter [Pseudomonas massiliensis]|uniref:MFS transporter n=1 Tax=Pseudomonas massiliensis TaxID=522492 RepID=UPI000694D400|nr:MFS transporter [Pseudomonas massiliensis]
MPAVMPLLLLVVLLGVFPMDVMLASIPSMALHFESSTQRLVANVALFPMFAALAQLIVGAVSDRYGRKSLLMACLGMAAVGGLGSAFASSFTGFTFWRAMQALGCGGLVLVHALVQDLYPARQRTRQRIGLNTASGVFISLSPLAGVVLEGQLGWRGSFWVFAGLCALAALLAAKILPGGVSETRGERLGACEALTHKVNFACAALLAMLLFTAHFSFIVLSPLIFLEQLNRSSTAYGFAMLAYGSAYLAGGVIAGRVASRYTEIAQMGFALALVMAGGTLMTLLHGLIGMTLFSLLSGGCLMVVGVTLGRPAATTVAMNSLPGRAGLAAAILNALTLIGGGALSALLGLFAKHSLWLLPGVWLALGTLGCCLILHPRIRRPVEAPLTGPAPAKR